MPTIVQRRLMWLLAIGQMVVLVGLALYPINAIMIRVPMLALGLTLWLTALALAWRWRASRYLLAALPVVLGVVLVLPGRSLVNTADLRTRVVTAL
ncbi:MAG TPA: hypothetical protein VHX44_03850, partial [Planctomycetota bacterium]|nr:hypothetical protein [Planctomycetota bacterium]